MLEELLKKCFDEETDAEKSAENIKTAVLSRIEEEKTMKHFTIKPLLIAAAATATAAVSVVTANAATDGAVVDGIAKTFSFILNGEKVEGTITEYVTGDDGKAERINIELPDEAVNDNTQMIVVEEDDGKFKILNGDETVFDSQDGDPVSYSEGA